MLQAELDLRVSQDQVTALKKHNAQLACRCREEAKAKLKEHDERVETQDKVGIDVEARPSIRINPAVTPQQNERENVYGLNGGGEGAQSLHQH